MERGEITFIQYINTLIKLMVRNISELQSKILNIGGELMELTIKIVLDSIMLF